MRTVLGAGAAIAALAFIGTQAASGVALPMGTYNLHNHPDGSARPPLYGVRFDELVNATSNHDIFTLDFNHTLSNMQMSLTPGQIHIFGQAYGGRDGGTSYVNDALLGVYQLSFIYNIGVGLVPGDDDIFVTAADNTNFGSVTLPGGSIINLTNMNMGGYSFRLGDENNDLGHRGHAGISGWGWMNYVVNGQVMPHTESTDWLFTATPQIPAPGAGVLALTGLVLVARRRR